MMVIDERPVTGGPLIVNVDTVIGRQDPSRDRGLGFRVHRFCPSSDVLA